MIHTVMTIAIAIATATATHRQHEAQQCAQHNTRDHTRNVRDHTPLADIRALMGRTREGDMCWGAWQVGTGLGTGEGNGEGEGGSGSEPVHT